MANRTTAPCTGRRAAAGSSSAFKAPRLLRAAAVSPKQQQCAGMKHTDRAWQAGISPGPVATNTLCCCHTLVPFRDQPSAVTGSCQCAGQHTLGGMGRRHGSSASSRGRAAGGSSSDRGSSRGGSSATMDELHQYVPVRHRLPALTHTPARLTPADPTPIIP